MPVGGDVRRLCVDCEESLSLVILIGGAGEIHTRTREISRRIFGASLASLLLEISRTHVNFCPPHNRNRQN